MREVPAMQEFLSFRLNFVIREKQGARLLAQQREAGKKIAENTRRLPTG
jgi:hypothetical protein